MTDGPGPRVLIADDDPGIRRLLAVSLKRDGYETVSACDGREALDAMRDRHVDLLLLDLMMPNVTGWDVLRERAGAPELRNIPVIVITAARGDAVAGINDDEICALLTKPFDLESLRALVKSCLLQAGPGADVTPRGPDSVKPADHFLE